VTTQRVSSPLSTGGAGTFFEQQVGAFWLSHLLVRAIPPILINCNVVEVAFQTEVLGWKTDDFLVTCLGADGVKRLLIGQVKRSFSISSSDEECSKAFIDFWQDYHNTNNYDPAKDRFVLTVQRGTNVLLNDFGGLLECARSSQDATDFEKRLLTPGFISKKASHYCNELCAIITKHEMRDVTREDIWPFIKTIYIISLDLGTTTNQAVAQLKTLLAHTVTSRDPMGLAEDSWNSLLLVASTSIPNASRLLLKDLPEELRKRHEPLAGTAEMLLSALKNHMDPILNRIKTTLGGQLHIQRANLVQQILDELKSAQIVIISGPAGHGKSVIGKEVVQHLSKDCFTFGFRVEEFAKAHIDETFHAAQIPSNAKSLAAILSTQPQKLILIESVERLLEKSTRDAFSDLMTLAVNDPNLCLLLTCRDYSVELVGESIIRQHGLTHSVISIPDLSDEELFEVEQHKPELAKAFASPRLRDILRNPFFLDKALTISWPKEQSLPESERGFRNLFWNQKVLGASGNVTGVGRKREEALQEIAKRRAQAMTEFVSTMGLPPDIVAELRNDSLIIYQNDSSTQAAVAHDVLEDWAILQWLDELHSSNPMSLDKLSSVIGTHPAIRRSYRKWLAELLAREPENAEKLFSSAISSKELSSLTCPGKTGPGPMLGVLRPQEVFHGQEEARS
jgi:hypothetical protein